MSDKEFQLWGLLKELSSKNEGRVSFNSVYDKARIIEPPIIRTGEGKLFKKMPFKKLQLPIGLVLF